MRCRRVRGCVRLWPRPACLAALAASVQPFAARRRPPAARLPQFRRGAAAVGHGDQPLPRRDAPGGRRQARQPRLLAAGRGLRCPALPAPCVHAWQPSAAPRLYPRPHTTQQMVSYLGPNQPVLMSALARWIRVSSGRGRAAAGHIAGSHACRRCRCSCRGRHRRGRCCCAGGRSTAGRPGGGPTMRLMRRRTTRWPAGLPLGAEKPRARVPNLGGGPAGKRTARRCAAARNSTGRGRPAPAAHPAAICCRRRRRLVDLLPLFPLLPPCRSGSWSRRSCGRWRSRPTRRSWRCRRGAAPAAGGRWGRWGAARRGKLFVVGRAV